MLRATSILCLLAAGGLAWLIYGDRQSPMAMMAVEWQGQLPVPIWVVPLTLGVVLGLLSKPKRAPVNTAARPQRRRPVPQAEPLPDGNWLQEVQRRAASLTLESGGLLTMDLEGDVPFSLHLTRMPPERARRAVESFVKFLATVPTPPRARILYQDCSAPTVPRAKQVAGSLRTAFPPDHVRAVGSGEQVELLFTRADPRWSLPPEAEA